MEKIKHNHCLTDILKVCLFSLLMIAPLLASVSQMLYVTLNKNAKDSYSGHNQYDNEITPINNVTSLIEGLEYNLKYVNRDPSTSFSTFYGFSKINLDITQFTNYVSGENYNLVYTTAGGNIYVKSDNSTAYYRNVWGISIKDIVFTYNGTYQSGANINQGNSQLIFVSLKSQELDNAFYYGVDQMTQSDLFNWTQNTGIYTGVHAMTSGIGIESKFIPMLLTYWLILTIVYIIIDVVIETFKYLTHILQNKVKSKTS